MDGWHLTEIEKHLGRIASLLERSVIRGGEYDGHLMTVAKLFNQDDNEDTCCTSVQRSPESVTYVDVPLPGNYTEHWEVIISHRHGGLPQRTQSFDSEDAALAFFNGRRGTDGINLTMNRVIKVQTDTYLS